MKYGSILNPLLYVGPLGQEKLDHQNGALCCSRGSFVPEWREKQISYSVILCVATRCPRGSLVPYINEEQISCSVNSLCCSSLSQRQSRPIQKWGAYQLCSPFSVLHLAIPEAALSYTKSRSIISAGLIVLMVLAGWPQIPYGEH